MRGKLGRVSRFVPFSPMLFAGLTGWWDASDSATLFDATTGGSQVSADGGVARLEDKSGAARHFTQSTAATRPTRKTAVQNGLDVLRLDGNDRMTSSALFSSLFSAAASACFVVAKISSAGTLNSNAFSNAVVLSDSQGGHGFFVSALSFSGSFGYDSAYRQAIISQTLGNWIVLSTWHNGSTLSVANSAGQSLSVTMGSRTAVSGSMILGANYLQQVLFNGDVGEIITYNQALSSGDRAAVQSALMTKWGIT